MGYKRPFTLFLCLIVLGYLIAAPMILCSIDRELLLEGKRESETPNWQGVITLWDIPRYTTSGSAFGWIKARIVEFEEKTPGVFIHLRELNYENNKEILLKAALEDSENRPDIMPLYIENAPIPLENVEPLNPWMDKKGVIPQEFLSYVSYQHSIYGVPFAASGSVLILNKAILDQLGYQAPKTKEWTYEDFMTYIQGLDKAKGGEDYLTFDTYMGKGDLGIMPILLSDGGQIYQEEEGRFTFYQPEMVSGLQKLVAIKSRISTHEEFSMRSRNDVYKDFLEDKKTAIFAGDSSMIGRIEGLKSKGEDFSYLVMPFPTGNIDVPIWYSHHLDSYAMMKSEDKAKQEVIMAFFEFLLEEESQRSLASLGKFPLNKGAKDLYKETPHIHEWYDRGYEYQSHPLHPNWEGIEYHIIECIQSVLTDKKSPTQAYQELQKQLNAQ